MKWIEIIELQSVSGNQVLLETNLKNLINEIGQKIENQSIKIYNHISIETNFSIYICNESINADINGSSLGLRLASTLKEFGLVNHSVWIERFYK